MVGMNRSIAVIFAITHYAPTTEEDHGEALYRPVF